MMIRRISYTLYILLSLTLLSSCNTMDEMLDEKQDTATLTVKIAQQDPTTVTRSVTETIRNVNILVFNAQGNLIGSTYNDSAPTSVSVPVRISSGCTICAIANTASGTYFDGISTLTELKAKATTAVTDPTAIADIMYGEKSSVNITSSTASQDIKVKRLYSKYTFTITPSSDIAITGYQLCNVPNECSIASGNTKNPTTGFAGLNYDAVATPVYAGSVVTAGSYYIYENLAGTNNTLTTAEQRTSVNAPTGSSYLLITARGIGYNAGWTSTYRVYLGGVTNAASPVLDYTNFNINRNFNYQCNIAITGSGATDVRVSYSPTTSTRTNVYFGDATVGNYLYADGTNGPTFKSGQTVGLIFSSELTQAQYNAGCRHGRVLALKDAYNGTRAWSSNSAPNNSPYLNQTVHPYCQAFSTCFNDVSSGYDASSSAFASLSSNPAWSDCKNYSDGTTKSFTNSGWYLPSAGDWWDIMENLCTWTESDMTTIKAKRATSSGMGTIILKSGYYTSFDSKLTAAGGTALIHTNYFWAASECNSSLAVVVGFFSNGVNLVYNDKTVSTNAYVRAVLAY